MRAIVSGFDVFGAYEFNPTYDLAREFDGRTIGGIEVTGATLPCSYYDGFNTLLDEMQRHSPDLILSYGLATRVPKLRIEAVGTNMMGSNYADSDGFRPNNIPILPGERATYPVTADNLRLAHALFESGIPCQVSLHAESFVCNSLIYLTARWIEMHKLPVVHAHIHTPFTDDYLDRVQLPPSKVAIPGDHLRRSVEIALNEMGRQFREKFG